MFAQQAAAVVRSAMLVLGMMVVAGSAQAQQPPPATVALARELIALKGVNAMFDPLVRGVVERSKSVLLRSNPMVSRELNDVAAKLYAEFAPRIAEVRDNVARTYASRFTEQELKDALAFYKTPVGAKLIQQEPTILDQSMREAQSWGDKLSEEVISRMRAEMRKKGHEL